MEKKSAILQMFNQKKGHCNSVPSSKKYQAILSDLVEKIGRLENLLKDDPETLELYRHTRELSIPLESDCAETHYLEGFRFGLLMGLDAVNEDVDVTF